MRTLWRQLRAVGLAGLPTRGGWWSSLPVMLPTLREASHRLHDLRPRTLRDSHSLWTAHVSLAPCEDYSDGFRDLPLLSSHAAENVSVDALEWSRLAPESEHPEAHQNEYAKAQ